MAPVPIVLDTDIGTDIDDLVALVIAATDTRLDLRGVTTVGGDTTLRARIARHVLDLVGRPDVPVGAGASTTLTGAPLPDGFGHEGEGFDLTAAVAFPSAAELLSALLGTTGEPLTICGIGPCTNIATALLADGGLIERVRAVHLMGGCFGPVRHGAVEFSGAGFPEYNVSADPLAAMALLGLPCRVLMTPLEVTSPLLVDSGFRAAVRQLGPLGALLDRQMATFVRAKRAVLASTGRPRSQAAISLHDVAVVAGLAEPSIVATSSLLVALRVDAGGACTVTCPTGRRAEVVRRADHLTFRRYTLSALTTAAKAARGNVRLLGSLEG